MNQLIKMLLPQKYKLREVIKHKYKDLYNKWRMSGHGNNNYTLQQLNQNIAKAYSIVKMSFPAFYFRKSKYNQWAEKDWYEISYSHWFFAVVFIKDREGSIRACIQDAHYEADHHNDIMQTQPYVDESYRRVMNLMERLDNLYK